MADHEKHGQGDPSVLQFDSGGAAVEQPKTYCAQRLEQVEQAWGLVYKRYAEMGLIDENPFGIHTTSQAVGSNACVIYQALRGNVISTLTAMADDAKQLPLDSVYGDLLDELRQQGRMLVEVGLMADRRHDIRRTAKALFAIMTWAAYYTLNFDRTDIVIGVHPHHVGFYQRGIGFQPFGEEKQYPTVNSHPVVLLRLALREALQQETLAPGLKYVRNNPIVADNYARRFMFDADDLRGSRIEGVLNSH